MESSPDDKPLTKATKMAKLIDHADGHLAQIGELCLNDLYSDVTLMVEGQALKAHRNILAAKSDYFRSLLTSGMKESHSKEVELKETPIRGFRLLLRYIYTGQMSLADQDLEVILEVLGLAHKYCFAKLEKSLSEDLLSNLSAETVCRIFETALLYKMKPLIKASYAFFDDHGGKVLEHPSFLKLPQHLVTDIFSRDSFALPEVKIFKAAQKWLESNTRTQEEDGAMTASSDVANQVLSKVRLELIPVEDLILVVRPSGLVSQDTLLDIMEYSLKTSPKNPRMVNVVSEENGTKVLCGKDGANLLNKHPEGIPASHICVNKKLLPPLVVNDAGACNLCGHFMSSSGIVVMLGKPFVINHIVMELWGDDDYETYSYVIDVSVDGITWDRVIDYSSFQCRSLQNLFFPQRTVKYIRIIGTEDIAENIRPSEFHVTSLKAFYTNKAVSFDKANIVVPSQNVAASGSIRHGDDDIDGSMLDESGYTYHFFDSEGDWDCIKVQLAQPYILESIRLELDNDTKHDGGFYSYSYFVEVSTDDDNWDRIWDRSGAITESGWQNITFPSRPVVYIRITGTGSTRTDRRTFYVENFECPSSVVIGTGKSD